MIYNIIANLEDGHNVFTGQLGFVPRKGEVISIAGHEFIVLLVKYVLTEGTSHSTTVYLTLKH